MTVLFPSGSRRSDISFSKRRVYFLRNSMYKIYMFENKEIAAKLADIHDTYVVVPVDKASNNVVFVCKKYYIQCLIK